MNEVFQGSAYAWDTTRGVMDVLWGAFWDVVRWVRGLEQTHPVAYWALVVAGAVVVIVALVHAIVLVVRTVQRLPASVEAAVGKAAPARNAEWYRRQAAALAADNRFLDAMGHLFAALILELDRRNVVRFHPSKTPAEYLGEAKLDEEGRQKLRTLIDDLYAALFGGRVPRADDWAKFAERVHTVVESYAA